MHTKSTKRPLLARSLRQASFAPLARSPPDRASARLLRNRTSATGLEYAEPNLLRYNSMRQ
jgi:hypothetical protein